MTPKAPDLEGSGEAWGTREEMPRLSAFSVDSIILAPASAFESQEKLAGDSKGGFLDFWDAIESHNLTFSAL